MKIKIDPQFSTLIPPVGDDAELEAVILADGKFTDPLIVWDHQNILLDGHRRHKIASKHPTIPAPKPIILKLESRDDANNWIIDHQLSKRNVTDEQKRYLLGKKYLSHKPPANRPAEDKSGTMPDLSNDEESSGNSEENSKSVSAESIAAEAGVDEKTVRKAAEFAAALDAAAAVAGEVVKTNVLSKEIKATTAALEKLAALPDNTAKRIGREIASGKHSSVKDAIDEIVVPAPRKSAAPLPIVDHFKLPVPKSLHPIFDDVKRFKSLMSEVSSCKGVLKKLCESPAAARLDAQEIERLLTQAHACLRFGLPYTECPKCRRKLDKKCTACLGNGWIHERMYSSSATDDDKVWLEART